MAQEGTHFLSPTARFEETIVFVPFFGGRLPQLRRHIEFVNHLGFNAVAIDLPYDDKWVLNRVPVSVRTRQIGLKHRWADEIEDVLRAVSGPKIMYAFSNPCSCGIEALVRGRGQPPFEVKALICDSGPFVHLWNCNWKFLTLERPIKNWALRAAANVSIMGLWGVDHTRSLHRDLAQLPKNYPVLSIRGWNDPLVPLSAIEEAFAPHLQLGLEILSLPEGGHLDGLKNFPNEYEPRVEKFLKSHATLLAHPS